METKIHAIELDADGRFACDAPGFDPDAPTLDNWTRDRCPDGLYQARYTGTRNAITGEWTGGNWVDAAAPDLLALAKEAKRAEINAWRAAEEAGGIDHAGHRWDTDAAARERIMAVALAGIEPPTGYWTDADNNDVPMTGEQLRALYGAILALGGRIHNWQRAMKEEVDALIQINAVKNYPVGWPD